MKQKYKFDIDDRVKIISPMSDYHCDTGRISERFKKDYAGYYVAIDKTHDRVIFTEEELTTAIYKKEIAENTSWDVKITYDPHKSIRSNPYHYFIDFPDGAHINGPAYTLELATEIVGDKIENWLNEVGDWDKE